MQLRGSGKEKKVGINSRLLVLSGTSSSHYGASSSSYGASSSRNGASSGRVSLFMITLRTLREIFNRGVRKVSLTNQLITWMLCVFTSQGLRAFSGCFQGSHSNGDKCDTGSQ